MSKKIKKSDFVLGEDRGEATEREMDSREGARAMGFTDLTSDDYDTMSDLNVKANLSSGSVDSLSSNDGVDDALDLSEFDTITDTNTLMSTGLISGAYLTGDAFSARTENDSASAEYDISHEDDFDEDLESADEDAEASDDEKTEIDESDERLADRLAARKANQSAPPIRDPDRGLNAALETDTVFTYQTNHLGMRNQSDRKTVQKYIDAQEK